jgi:head-tail adaptor
MLYRPKSMQELRTPVKLQKPTGNSKVNGVTRYTYESLETADVIFTNWKTYGGTENVVNGIVSIIDTASITTRYRPDIKANCRLVREDGAVYEIVSEPENIDMANRYLQLKCQRVKGGV